MAKSKKKLGKGVIKFGNVISSVGGGFGSTFLMNQLDSNVPVFTKNKNLAPLVNGAAALLIVFFGGKAIEPLGYGMLGASGGDFSNDLLNGLSRIEIENETLQGEKEELQEEIDILEDEKDNLEDAEILEEA